MRGRARRRAAVGPASARRGRARSMIAVAALAAFVPARRAGAIDPIVVLEERLTAPEPRRHEARRTHEEAGLYKTFSSCVFVSSCLRGQGPRYNAAHERSTRRLRSARARGPDLHRRRRAAPRLGTGVARRARVVQGQGRRARPARRDRFGRQQLGDAARRVAEDGDRRQPSRLGAQRRLARRLPRRRRRARGAADARAARRRR